MKIITEGDFPKIYIHRKQTANKRKFMKTSGRQRSRATLYFLQDQKCAGENCNETNMIRMNIDHIIPMAVAYYMNWDIVKTNLPENRQLLCRKCHEEKDKDTDKLTQAAKAYQQRMLRENNFYREPKSID